MFEPAEIPYTVNGEDRIFRTTQRMVSFLRPILMGEVYPIVDPSRPPRAVLDIGANHGAASIFFAESFPAARVYSFEPGSKNFNLLEENVAHYPPERMVRFHLGVGARAAQLPLYDGVYNEGEASLTSPAGLDMPSELCAFVPIAQAIPDEDERARIDLVKIDVEGAECEVLADVLSSSAPRVVYLEYQNPGNRIDVQQQLLGHYHLTHHRILGHDTGEMIFQRK